jgi:hypothetical protein
MKVTLCYLVWIIKEMVRDYGQRHTLIVSLLDDV